MKTKLWIFAIALLLIAAGTGNQSKLFAATATQTASDTVVKIDNFSFSPATLTVRWANGDDIPHSIASDDKAFKSKALDTDERFTYRFTRPGTYGYFCGLHPKMTAKIVVQ